MKTDAAILNELQKPLVVTDIEIPSLKPGQVLVDISYSGICHTQLSECKGNRGEDKFLPHCLGHEGSGVVREIGSGITKVKVRDRVIISWIKGTGADVSSTVYQWGNTRVNAGGVTTFSRQSVISENRLTVIPNDISMEAAALIGCAVPTGMGAVLNTAHPRPGQSIAIFGTGGIGLCAVAGCAAALNYGSDRQSDARGKRHAFRQHSEQRQRPGGLSGQNGNRRRLQQCADLYAGRR